MMENIIRRLGGRLINWLLCICGGMLFLAVFQVLCYTSFNIPSDSMEPSLVAGDKIVVNKMIQGARIFDVFAALERKEFHVFRIPGYSKWKRNDVLVFNFPYPDSRDHISFDLMQYYVKRCIALPGDTMEIRNGFFKIRGVNEPLGNVAAQRRISQLNDSGSQGVVMRAFPRDKRLNWTIKEFGPLVVPVKGQIVQLDSMVYSCYRRLIVWEQKKELVIKQNGVILLGDSIIQHYQFKENYYFVAGDKAENSKDSRYWGMLPESFIVGKAILIWQSDDVLTGKIRWERIWRKIN